MCTGQCRGVVAGMFITVAAEWSGMKSRKLSYTDRRSGGG
jgi:hypothetical protein